MHIQHNIWEKGVHSIFMIHEFHICEFAHLLKFICNPPISLVTLPWSFSDVHRVVKNTSHPPTTRVPSWSQARPHSAPTINKRPFRSLFGATFFAFLCSVFFFFGHFTIWNGPPSIVLKGYLVFPDARKLWCFLRRKRVLDKLPSDKGYRAGS